MVDNFIEIQLNFNKKKQHFKVIKYRKTIFYEKPILIKLSNQ